MATKPARVNWSQLELTTPITEEPTPAADRELLMMAEFFVRAVATSPYANAGKIYDGGTEWDTNNDGTVNESYQSRMIRQIFAPATAQARFFVYRFGVGSGAQSQTKVSGTESGLSIFSAVDSPATGAEFFGRWDNRIPAGPSVPLGVNGTGALALSGTMPAGVNNTDSYVSINESLAPTPQASQAFRVLRAYGFSFFVPKEGQSPNLEVL